MYKMLYKENKSNHKKRKETNVKFQTSLLKTRKNQNRKTNINIHTDKRREKKQLSGITNFIALISIFNKSLSREAILNAKQYK